MFSQTILRRTGLNKWKRKLPVNLIPPSAVIFHRLELQVYVWEDVRVRACVCFLVYCYSISRLYELVLPLHLLHSQHIQWILEINSLRVVLALFSSSQFTSHLVLVFVLHLSACQRSKTVNTTFLVIHLLGAEECNILIPLVFSFFLTFLFLSLFRDKSFYWFTICLNHTFWGLSGSHVYVHFFIHSLRKFIKKIYTLKIYMLRCCLH